MKTKLTIIISLVFFCINTQAQESKYFNVEIHSERLSYLYVKDMVFRDVTSTGPTTDNYYAFDNMLGYMIDATKIYASVFGDVSNVSEEDFKDFPFIMYRFYFDKNFDIFYFSLSFPTKSLDKVPEMEEKLYQFGKKFSQQMKLDKYIRLNNPNKFIGDAVTISLANTYSYLKDPGRFNLINERE